MVVACSICMAYRVVGAEVSGINVVSSGWNTIDSNPIENWGLVQYKDVILPI